MIHGQQNIKNSLLTSQLPSTAKTNLIIIFLLW